MYHQPLHLLYTSHEQNICLNSYDLCVSYVEQHDENTVEFPHSHPKEFEIYYVQEGTMEQVVNGELLSLSEGDFLILNQGITHGTLYKPNQKKSYFALVFSLQKRSIPCYKDGMADMEALHLGAFLDMMREKEVFVCRDTKNCQQYIRQMADEFCMQSWGWFYKLQLLYATFILNVISNFMPPIQTTPFDPTRNLPIEFTKYLHANYPNPDLSLQDVADYFYMSPRHINRLFKDFFGASLSKTLTQYRINYAKNYLIDTDFSVDEIAVKVGFSSASTLSRLFKEVEGITISEYRYQYVHQAVQGVRDKNPPK
ncbi:MAG: AraC family transcriptional regulator [Lachnospiraceae bacterium]|jgi:AraC-like DNA-binding protein|nr:AraC family transcriptional regulator [Lachnospiraceae bacterium]